jgi:hypothetical protein
MRQVICAGTTHPNTLDTDKLRKVSHDVDVRVSATKIERVRFLSTDPMTAIEEANAMTDEEYARLERVKTSRDLQPPQSL